MYWGTRYSFKDPQMQEKFDIRLVWKIKYQKGDIYVGLTLRYSKHFFIFFIISHAFSFVI